MNKQYDVVVVGGGLAGVCAAIASARQGANTVLIQDRPILGGNASSEIRMHICGANMHGTRKEARETGIIEEILLENKKRNPQHSFSILDTIIWEKVRFQENLTLHLNTRMIKVQVHSHDAKMIQSITVHQMTTDKEMQIEGEVFIDCTGDSTLADRAGASYRVGREGKKVFNEQFAPDKCDNNTMGNTLMFKAIDYGKPVPFEKPSWAYTFTEEDLKNRGHSAMSTALEHYGVDSGYWWIELGGTEDTIRDAEEIRDELLKTVYGIWDHIKNAGDHGAANYVLDWVQFLPGKRESRRIEGEYILKEQDLLEGRIFDDAVAYGGWPMDMHPPEGFKYKGESNEFIEVPLYTIPYRCYYSKNISNLMMAGRNISTSHMAFCSTRVMGTCAVGGQAVGIAAALAIHYGCRPKEIGKRIKEVQQILLKADCFLPGYSNKDEKDKALHAKVTASSQLPGYEAIKIVNGYGRNEKDKINCWKANDVGEEPWVKLKMKTQEIEEVHVKFDSELSLEIMTTLSDIVKNNQIDALPKSLIKDYEIQVLKNNEVVYKQAINNNYLRHTIHRFPEKVIGDTVKLLIKSTWGDKEAAVYEVRIY